ncbi:MAG: ATP-dependent RNA helicase HrpA [Gammaproteobacteria bacterium]
MARQDTITTLSADIALCLRRDQHALRRRLRKLRRDRVRDNAAWQSLSADIAASKAHCAQRRAALPVPSFPEELPVSARREELAEAIARHQVVIVCGETGSGKTTQLPKICLSLGRGVAGMIGHTQPRRIAARSVAARVAEELDTPVGQIVGYKVRFSDHTSPEAYIKVMTDGILLAETQHDRYLDHYDTLIIDEAHERSLNIDFLLGYLKQVLPKRPDLKLIITSATIDPQRFAKHFDDAPIVEVSGRTYPVEVRYRPLLAEDDDGRDRDLQQAILDAVDELGRIDRGDILVFLSGEREIRAAAEALRKHHPPHTEILPLYARLSAAEQNKVFQRHIGRRIVLATNVAETSLTVPGIRYVIDTGLARVSRYSHRAKVQRLPIEPVSQASANQRAGRCGRVSAGVCVRLYSEDDYVRRPPFTAPEIQRSNLAAVILQMEVLGLGNVGHFPFIDPPDPRLIKDGYQTLVELGAVDEARRLLPLGRDLARLPVDPRLGRMILAARQEQCLSDVLIIAAALAVQDPRERPLEAQQAADQKHGRFADQRSDFLAYLKLWEHYHEQARHLSNNKLRKYCRENFLSYVRMQDWRDVHSQLLGVLKPMGYRLNQQPADYAPIHRALLSGLLGNIGSKSEERDYLGARGSKFHIFPGSALFKKAPKWLVAAELVETTRLYARTVAKIEPEWVEQLATHLVKHHYFDPHWEKSRQAVMGYERVSLYGLPLIPRRKIHYGRIDPRLSRELFIRGALVAGEYDTRAPFFTHNRAAIRDVEELEHKARRRDILVDEQTLYEFYDARIPADLCDGRSFERWRKDVERDEPQRLLLTKEYLMQRRATEVSVEQFPDHLDLAGMQLPLSYHFEPGHPLDGVTVTVPLVLLNQLPPERLEWLVPGLLRDKIIALLKGLPKALRRNFVPAPNFADACLQAMTPDEGSLHEALARHLARMTGVTVPAEAWQEAALPPHLRMNVKVVATDGETVVAMGRDAARLRGEQGEQAAATFAQLPSSDFERDRVTAWDFGDLPEKVEFQRHGMRLSGYPALVEEDGGVALRLLDSPAKAETALRGGVRRLYMLQARERIKYLEKNLPGIQTMCLHYAGIGDCATLKADLLTAITHQAFLGDRPLPRSAAQFNANLAAGQARLIHIANELCAWVAETLALHHALAKRLKGALKPAWLKSLNDIQDQLRHLVYTGFVTATPYGQLPHLPRYLKAVELRLAKLEQHAGRDAPLLAQLLPLWQAYWQRAEKQRKLGIADAALEEYHWLLEELRVSLFAQELKTAVPVSVQRLQRQWAAIGG